jgi:hypothetical protein
MGNGLARAPHATSAIMPSFHIRPSGRGDFREEIVARDEAAVLSIIEMLNIEVADVTREGEYVFSVRLTGDGLWYIFQRPEQHHATHKNRGADPLVVTTMLA